MITHGSRFLSALALCASIAATQTTAVNSPSFANWGTQWHWTTSLTLNGGTESPVQRVLAFALPADSPPVIGINQKRAFNRPLYVNNTATFVLTGDKPMAKFASSNGNVLFGAFFVGRQPAASATLAACFNPAAPN